VAIGNVESGDGDGDGSGGKKAFVFVFGYIQVLFGYELCLVTSSGRDQLRPVRLVFCRSLNFRNRERPKTGLQLRSLTVLGNFRSWAVLVQSSLRLFPVLGLDFQALKGRGFLGEPSGLRPARLSSFRAFDAKSIVRGVLAVNLPQVQDEIPHLWNPLMCS
jgi:hypothetical protein